MEIGSHNYLTACFFHYKMLAILIFKRNKEEGIDGH